MNPVTQTTFGMPRGNCFAACVASILEVRLECVPHVMHYDDKWFPAFNLWANRHGLQLLSHAWNKGLVSYLREHHRNTYAIVSGPAARGFEHCCVYLGIELAHDPHPDRTGLLEEKTYDVLILSDAVKLAEYRTWAIAHPPAAVERRRG